jgi:hypothetical protein
LVVKRKEIIIISEENWKITFDGNLDDSGIVIEYDKAENAIYVKGWYNDGTPIPVEGMGLKYFLDDLDVLPEVLEDIIKQRKKEGW